MPEEKHKHGTMDISEQEATFGSFVLWVTRVVITTVVVLILLYLING